MRAIHQVIPLQLTNKRQYLLIEFWLPYYIVDAFTSKRFEGAQIAVIPDASDLNNATMQKIAREFNVSETVFVFPGKDAFNKKLRIFTPTKEIPFAGHPTIATAYILLNNEFIRTYS